MIFPIGLAVLGIVAGIVLAALFGSVWEGIALFVGLCYLAGCLLMPFFEEIDRLERAVREEEMPYRLTGFRPRGCAEGKFCITVPAARQPEDPRPRSRG